MSSKVPAGVRGEKSRGVGGRRWRMAGQSIHANLNFQNAEYIVNRGE